MFIVEGNNIAFKISIFDSFATYKILHYSFKVCLFIYLFQASLGLWWIISKDSERIN